jgi:hypothetical protein
VCSRGFPARANFTRGDRSQRIPGTLQRSARKAGSLESFCGVDATSPCQQPATKSVRLVEENQVVVGLARPATRYRVVSRPCCTRARHALRPSLFGLPTLRVRPKSCVISVVPLGRAPVFRQRVAALWCDRRRRCPCQQVSRPLGRGSAVICIKERHDDGLERRARRTFEEALERRA